MLAELEAESSDFRTGRRRRKIESDSVTAPLDGRHTEQRERGEDVPESFLTLGRVGVVGGSGKKRKTWLSFMAACNGRTPKMILR